MKALLAELRSLTGVGTESYESAGVKRWSDAELEAKLGTRVSGIFVQSPVELIPSLSPEGSLEFLAGRVPVDGSLDVDTATFVTFWGGQIPGTGTVTPFGFCTFTESQVASMPLLSGTAYDLYGAAADILTDWASAVKLGYDLTTDGQTLKRSQRHEQLMGQAEDFRKRAVIGSVQMRRGDVKADNRSRVRTRALLDSFNRWGLYPPRSR